MTQSEKIVLPADEFDALEMSVYVAGGVGRGIFFEDHFWHGCAPVCLLGHLAFVHNTSAGMLPNPVSTTRNDAAVDRINARKGAPHGARVSWEEYTKELPLVRGD